MKPIKPIVITSQQQFDLDKPRYNPFQTGHGIHKSKKGYSRKAKHKGLNLE